MITEILDDYDLDGVITGFESYMLATTDRQIAKHSSFDNFYVAYACTDCNSLMEVFELKERKEFLKFFNRDIPLAAKNYPTVIVYFDNIEDIWWIQKQFTAFCVEHKTFGFLAVHADQIGQRPHLHILYAKHKPRKIKNELSDYLREALKQH